ncbi:MAG: methionine gamma-lyase family protein [Clostridia bacterium]|nr:methionine gamma-lyase family protein [Clostridia bacterium]
MIDEKVILKAEDKLKDTFKYFEDIALYNQEKVLNAFKKNKIALRHFNGSSGYGYGDEGRDTLNQLVADVFGTEKAVCSPFIVSGTHALSLCLYAILRPNDCAVCITGEPYDTLSDVIKGKDGSLDDYNISFYSVPLKGDKIDYVASIKLIKDVNPKLIYIQRSRGYEWRDALSINDIKSAIETIKSSGFDGIIMVDNCYGEFLDKLEPTEVGANIMAGSMIKNLGGGIAPTGGYIVGDGYLIDKVNARLTAPSIAGEVGSYSFGYQQFYQGIFLAPHVVLQAVKGSLLFGAVLSELGYETSPKLNSYPNDIIRAIKFNDKDKLIKFIQTIQANSPIDSNVLALPWDMPGYTSQVIMAAGCFVQGSSIELSADAPIRPPYIGYLQCGLTYEHCKIALKNMDL